MADQISVELREFDRSIEQAYKELFPGDPDKSPEMLRWRFTANPHGVARFAVAIAGDRIAGMIALVPARLSNANGATVGYQAIDTVVHPSFQGRGIFVRMGSAAQQPKALRGQILWGFPNANASPGWYGRLGWTNFGPVPLLMRPLRSSFLLGRLHPKLRAIDVQLIRNRPAAVAYESAADCAVDFDALWRRVRSGFGTAVDREGDWIRWRLFDKPHADYRCAGMRSTGAELDAFVATKVAEKHGGRLCYVMEALAMPSRMADLAQVLLAELARAARNGAEVALAWCPRTAPNYAAYRKAGFLPVPQRLRPIEINFGARPLSAEGASAAAAGASWYVSFLDSDTN